MIVAKREFWFAVRVYLLVALLGGCVAVIATLLGFPLFSTSHAHSWYPEACCGGDEHTGDCYPIDCKELHEEGDGVLYRDPKQGGRKLLFYGSMIRDSLDNRCHICINYGNPRCVFEKHPGTS